MPQYQQPQHRLDWTGGRQEVNIIKTNYILIDYENVQPSMVELLTSPCFKVIVFVGDNQPKVNLIW